MKPSDRQLSRMPDFELVQSAQNRNNRLVWDALVRKGQHRKSATYCLGEDHWLQEPKDRTHRQQPPGSFFRGWRRFWNHHPPPTASDETTPSPIILNEKVTPLIRVGVQVPENKEKRCEAASSSVRRSISQHTLPLPRRPWNTCAVSTRATIVAAAMLTSACSSYTDDTKHLRTSLVSGRYERALEDLDKSSLAQQKRNRVLYLMERGTILFLDEQYRTAARDWRKASEISEQLYTVSLSSAATSLAVNDSFSDYEGELHEKVLLPIFSALAYLADGDIGAARIETRRTDELMTALENAGSDRPEYARDSFAHLVSGLVYETLKEWDSALIEYRRGLHNLKSSRVASDASISADLFAKPLCRIAKLRKRDDLLKEVKRLADNPVHCPEPEDWMRKAEIVVFYENGRSPIKVARDIVLPVQGQVVRISYPSYERSYYSSRGATISVNSSQAGRTELAQNIGLLAQKALDARRAKDLIKMTARIIAKDQAARATGRALGPLAGLAASIVGAVTETADTRGWTSLPNEIQVLRVWVDPPKQGRDVLVRIDPDAGKPLVREFKVRESQKLFIRHRTFD